VSTWLITGCSTGLGRALAAAVLEHGDNAVVTARDVSKVSDLAGPYPGTALALPLDVTSVDQAAVVVRAAQERFGAVDVLVNNAGYGYRGAVEEGDDAEVRQLFAANFFGPVTMIKAVLPGMRGRRSGAILNISSIAAFVGPVASGYYAATKAALGAASGALGKELAPLGISVTVVELGAFRTEFGGRSLVQSSALIDDYAETAGRRRKERDTLPGNQQGDPAKAARALITMVESSARPARLLLGQDALGAFRRVHDAQLAEAEAWAELSGSTSFED
jgi:NAD(P)-dependent dehydrogenase (short-subunit alcohol dehydrogenase family)